MPLHTVDRSIGVRRDKTYRIYEKPLSSRRARREGPLTRFARTTIVVALASCLALLSCATSSNQQSPPAAGGTGWVPGDPLTTPVSDGTLVQGPQGLDAGTGKEVP